VRKEYGIIDNKSTDNTHAVKFCRKPWLDSRVVKTLAFCHTGHNLGSGTGLLAKNSE